MSNSFKEQAKGNIKIEKNGKPTVNEINETKPINPFVKTVKVGK